MRSLSEAREAWELLRQHASIGDLKTLARGRDALGRPAAHGLRSACWKAFLSLKTTQYDQWPSKLKLSRTDYASRKKRFLHGLQHQDEEDSMLDPLSDDAQSPWAALRQDELARQEIFQDVERCMPDNYYFRQPTTQTMLLDILFVWSKLNPSIGYRQGMHEVLAPVIWAIERDAIDPSSKQGGASRSDDVEIIFDAASIEHDAFVVFNAVMSGLQSAYAPPPPSRTRQQAEPPIVPRANNIVKGLLGATDMLLADHLAAIDIAPQLFIMRWIRLLFGREFAFDDMLLVWDLIFAEDASPEIIDLVCLSMLLRIRWQLVDTSYNEALTLLLRYPPLPNGQSAVSFVDDAIYLRNNLTLEVGYQVINKRTGRQPPPVSRPSTPPNVPLLDKLKSGRFASPVRRSPLHSRQSSNLEGMLQNAARGVFSRGEQINKAVRDAVGDFKDNVQHLRPPRLDGEDRPWSEDGGDQNNQSELLEQIEDIQARNKSLSKMLESAVNDLWKQHEKVVADKPAEDEQAKSFTMAIAKVQLAQVYLEDATLPITIDQASEPVEEAPKEPQPQPHPEPSPTPTSRRAPLRNTTPSRSRMAPSLKESSSIMTQSSATSDASSRSKKQPVEQDEKASDRTDADDMPSRPRLEQSSFSFMLGQDEVKSTAARNAFISASPFTDAKESHETRGLGYLFGGPRQEPSAAKSAQSEAKGKRRPKPQAAKEESEVMFDMEGLSDVKLND